MRGTNLKERGSKSESVMVHLMCFQLHSQNRCFYHHSCGCRPIIWQACGSLMGKWRSVRSSCSHHHHYETSSTVVGGMLLEMASPPPPPPPPPQRQSSRGNPPEETWKKTTMTAQASRHFACTQSSTPALGVECVQQHRPYPVTHTCTEIPAAPDRCQHMFARY